MTQLELLERGLVAANEAVSDAEATLGYALSARAKLEAEMEDVIRQDATARRVPGRKVKVRVALTASDDDQNPVLTLGSDEDTGDKVQRLYVAWIVSFDIVTCGLLACDVDVLGEFEVFKPSCERLVAHARTLPRTSLEAYGKQVSFFTMWQCTEMVQDLLSCGDSTYDVDHELLGVFSENDVQLTPIL